MEAHVGAENVAATIATAIYASHLNSESGLESSCHGNDWANKLIRISMDAVTASVNHALGADIWQAVFGPFWLIWAAGQDGCWSIFRDSLPRSANTTLVSPYQVTAKPIPA